MGETVAKKKPKQKGGRKPGQKTRNPAILEIDGIREMSPFDYQFCEAYVRCLKATVAYRMVKPEATNPKMAAHHMMNRLEIQQHIRSIFANMKKERERRAASAARSALLTLDVADDRLLEVLQSRRRTLGESVTRDTKQLFLEGASPITDDSGKVTAYRLEGELQQRFVTEGAPVEDADLLKAIKLTYERRGGIEKIEKQQGNTFIGTMLYKPKWLAARQPQMIDGEVA